MYNFNVYLYKYIYHNAKFNQWSFEYTKQTRLITILHDTLFISNIFSHNKRISSNFRLWLTLHNVTYHLSSALNIKSSTEK